jgi:enoyl-CoA hydratase/carnithine racemase
LIFDNLERHNAITADMWRAIPGAVGVLVRDQAVSVIILRGAGDQALVSGADISEFAANRSGAEARRYDEAALAAFSSLAEAPKPVIACIHGYCIGGGVGLSVSADLRYAADDAVFAVPAARLGLGYPLAGIESLVELLGPAYTKELIFTGRRFSAPEALARRLVNDVRPKTELD